MTNCFKSYDYWKCYLHKPWRLLSDTWLNLKAAWQRATRGWADRDVWSLDHYLLEILPEMVNSLRETTHGFPVNEKFSTMEEWDEFLWSEIVEPLRNARERQTIQINEYDYIYENVNWDFENGPFFGVPKELVQKWSKREQEIFSWREEQLVKGFSSLIDKNVYFNLWD